MENEPPPPLTQSPPTRLARRGVARAAHRAGAGRGQHRYRRTVCGSRAAGAATGGHQLAGRGLAHFFNTAIAKRVSRCCVAARAARDRSDAFPSMVAGKNENLLADIMSVEQGYPLRGKIIIDDGAQHVIKNENSTIPVRGTLWADERLMQRLGLQLGDEVGVGELHLRVAARVVRFVDQSVGFASFAPRVILNSEDLPGSGLVQEGSRIHYRLLIAGEAKQVADLRAWLQSRLTVSEKLEDVRDARPEIRTALERAEHFLGLAALTAVVLAGVALALAARH